MQSREKAIRPESIVVVVPKWQHHVISSKAHLLIGVHQVNEPLLPLNGIHAVKGWFLLLCFPSSLYQLSCCSCGRCCCLGLSLFVERLNPLVNILQVLVNHPPKIIQINYIEILQALTSQALVHDLSNLLFAVVLALFLELLIAFCYPLPEEALLVDHLLALLHLRHLLEMGKHTLDSQRGRPDFRLRVIWAIKDGTGINPTESAQLTHLLHQTLLPFLECCFSCRIISDVCKLHLLSSHDAGKKS